MESDQYYEQQTQAMPVAPGMNIQSTESSLRYQLESGDILEDIEHSLKSEILGYDSTTGKHVWYTPNGIHPLLNEHGINGVMTILRSRITKVFILSDLDKEQIENITLNIAQDVIADIELNWNKYDIKDVAAASTVVSIITDNIYATMRKAYVGKYLSFLTKTHSVSEIQQTNNNNRSNQNGTKESLLGALFKRK